MVYGESNLSGGDVYSDTTYTEIQDLSRAQMRVTLKYCRMQKKNALLYMHIQCSLPVSFCISHLLFLNSKSNVKPECEYHGKYELNKRYFYIDLFKQRYFFLFQIEGCKSG